MTQTKCDRCEDWWEPEEAHDFSHLEERQVAALERIAAALERANDLWEADTARLAERAEHPLKIQP